MTAEATQQSFSTPTTTIIHLSQLLPKECEGASVFRTWGLVLESGANSKWSATSEDGVGAGDLTIKLHMQYEEHTVRGEIFICQDPLSAHQYTKTSLLSLGNLGALTFFKLQIGDTRFQVVVTCDDTIKNLLFAAAQTLAPMEMPEIAIEPPADDDDHCIGQATD